MNKTSWTPNSWRDKQCSQQITYPDPDETTRVMQQLSALPPLVTPLEINKLKEVLVSVAKGEAFLLQGGDCAESFANCSSQPIINKLKILLQMSLILVHGLRKPIVRVGRIAGQYAKPRSSDTETINDVTLPSYRGDLINKAGFTLEERTPNPQLMLIGYQYAALTLNYIRALINDGFADLQHPEYWELEFVKHSPLADEYQTLVNAIADAVNFMRTIAGLKQSSLDRIDFYTSHEALNLYYEEALTHQYKGAWYDLSTHFPWVGMRTADTDEAHLEYLRGISNPIAVKVGPSVTAEKLVKLIASLNPENEMARLTLIMRLGAKNVATHLPKLIEAVQNAKLQVIWSCDPMHGNTQTTSQGIKTRQFQDILQELQESFRIHKQLGTHLGGVHFELTGEDVTECVGGARGLTEGDLHRAYESLCDPRLNYEQALEMALLIARSDHL